MSLANVLPALVLLKGNDFFPACPTYAQCIGWMKEGSGGQLQLALDR